MSGSSLEVSRQGHYFATYSITDRQVRVFRAATGKLIRVYDESIDAVTRIQQAGPSDFHIDDMEFGRRLAQERELDKDTASLACAMNTGRRLLHLTFRRTSPG